MSVAEFSGATTKKRRGRPKGAISAKTRELRDAVDELTRKFERMTVRQIFYALEVAEIVPKTEAGYRQVQTQILAMRRQGLLDWEFVTDGTRWQRKPDSYGDVGAYVEHVSRSYRRDLWADRNLRLEIWLEKDALADVVVDVTAKWDVALMVSRGQSSATFLHSAADHAERVYRNDGVHTYIYALYDHDAGGERAASTIERELPEYAPVAALCDAIHFERIAVTEDQIAKWGLPTRPPKASDPQAKAWGDRPCVELDAIPPNRLTRLVEDAIADHVDNHALQVHEVIEAEERKGLRALADAFQNGGAS
jgi:hypothetical protein